MTISAAPKHSPGRDSPEINPQHFAVIDLKRDLMSGEGNDLAAWDLTHCACFRKWLT